MRRPRPSCPRFLQNRSEIWKLDWLCQRYGVMPSDRLRLEANGVPEAVAYDFDFAVAMLASTMEARLRETVQVEVENGPKPTKGYHFEQRPKYTLAQLLFEPETGAEDDDGELPDVFAGLPAALLM